MNTDDDVEKNESVEESKTENVDKDNDEHMPVGVSTSDPAKTRIELYASGDGKWAALQLDYWWSRDGKTFTAETVFYRAKDNGESEGNVKLAVNEDTYRELTANAKQDEQWHPLNYTYSKAASSDSVYVQFYYIYDSAMADEHLYENVTVKFYPPPIILSPSGDIADSSFQVKGTQGTPGTDHVIAIYNADDDWYLGFGNPDVNGDWTAGISMSTSTLTFYAQQVIEGAVSEKSDPMTVNLILTTLTSPAMNAILPSKNDLFKGKGFPGTQVWAVIPNFGTPLSEKVLVDNNQDWQTPPLSSVASGIYSVQAAYQYQDGPIKYTTPAHSFTFVGAPVITQLTPPQNMTFTLSGTNGIQGGKVEVFIDPENRKVGEGDIGSDGSWSAGVTMPEPGSINLAAEQIVSGVRSQRSAARAFNIKPPALSSISVNYPAYDTVKFSGTGYATGKVEIHVDKNASSVVDTIVSNGGSWTVDWPDQPPKELQMYARQSVPDGAGTGGRIYSEWTDTSVEIPVPVPTLTAQEGTDRKPEFSGTGRGWTGEPAAQVEVRLQNASTPAVPIVEVVNKAWSSTATEAWTPGTYNIQARQLFNGMQSAWTAVVELVVKAPLPTVTVTTNGLRPDFSGTCLEGAEVNLGFTGDTGRPHKAKVTKTDWVFTPTQDFVPGPDTVRVTQSIGGQTSNEASASFDVPVLQPIIASPEEDEEVDHNPVIAGTAGVRDAVMEVFDNLTDKLLGSVDVTGDAWSMALQNYPFGLYTVYAIQQYGERLSDKSETRSFKVILFPPTIDNPEPDVRIARSFKLDGHARPYLNTLARVELWLKDASEPLASFRAAGDGYWWYDAQLPLGADAVRAKQFFGEEASAFCPEHAFTVVPSVPLIESPAQLQHIGPTVTISGHGYVGDQVEVAGSDAPATLLGTTQVQANGTWSLELHIDKPVGPYSLIVQQECEGYRSGWSAPHPVTLLSGAPTFTAPEAGRWVTGTPLFEGTGETGKTIEVSQWFDSRKVVTQDNLVTSGAWTASPAVSLAPGPHWMKARHGGSHSGDSNRFDVMPNEEDSGDDR